MQTASGQARGSRGKGYEVEWTQSLRAGWEREEGQKVEAGARLGARADLGVSGETDVGIQLCLGGGQVSSFHCCFVKMCLWGPEEAEGRVLTLAWVTSLWPAQAHSLSSPPCPPSCPPGTLLPASPVPLCTTPQR